MAQAKAASYDAVVLRKVVVDMIVVVVIVVVDVGMGSQEKLKL